MAYYLGIDGGGTKTRCVLADETTVLADAMTGGCSVLRVGEQQARESLHSAIRQGSLLTISTPSVWAPPVLPDRRSPRRFAPSLPN
jgi:N-acetylglucosamine kinase-like BadF-type ATPase